jgi:hypothetical protein
MNMETSPEQHARTGVCLFQALSVLLPCLITSKTCKLKAGSSNQTVMRSTAQYSARSINKSSQAHRCAKQK